MHFQEFLGNQSLDLSDFGMRLGLCNTLIMTFAVLQEK
jgi:hypothetical protein